MNLYDLIDNVLESDRDIFDNINSQSNFLDQQPWRQDFNFLDDAYNDLLELADENLDAIPYENLLNTTNLFGGSLTTIEPKLSERFNKKWHAKEQNLEFTLSQNEYDNFFSANEEIKNFFENIFTKYIEPIDSNTLVRYVINHDLFERAINTPFMAKESISASMI